MGTGIDWFSVVGHLNMKKASCNNIQIGNFNVGSAMPQNIVSWANFMFWDGI